MPRSQQRCTCRPVEYDDCGDTVVEYQEAVEREEVLVIDVEVEKLLDHHPLDASRRQDEEWLEAYKAMVDIDEVFWLDHDGIHDVDAAILDAFLKVVGVLELRPLLSELGASKLRDLQYITDEDLRTAQPEAAARLLDAIDVVRRSRRPAASEIPSCLVS